MLSRSIKNTGKPTNQFLASRYIGWPIPPLASATDLDSVMYLTLSNLPLHFRKEYLRVDGCSMLRLHVSTIFVKDIIYNVHIAEMAHL